MFQTYLQTDILQLPVWRAPSEIFGYQFHLSVSATALYFHNYRDFVAILAGICAIYISYGRTGAKYDPDPYVQPYKTTERYEDTYGTRSVRPTARTYG